MSWEEKVKKDKLRVRHLIYNGRLFGTLVYDQPSTTGLIYYGLAISNKKDKLSKKAGREIAYGRFMMAKYTDKVGKLIGHSLITCLETFYGIIDDKDIYLFLENMRQADFNLQMKKLTSAQAKLTNALSQTNRNVLNRINPDSNTIINTLNLLQSNR